jgi:hypothetical protein
VAEVTLVSKDVFYGIPGMLETGRSGAI